MSLGVPVFELPGDLPPTPFSVVESTHSSLRPAPLNFSRPRFGSERTNSSSFFRPAPLHPHPIESTNGEEDEQEEQEEETDATPLVHVDPPEEAEPVDLRKLTIEPDSGVDDLGPPPVLSHSVSVGSLYYKDGFPKSITPRVRPAELVGSAPGDPPPPQNIITQQNEILPESESPSKAWIYRPYLSSASGSRLSTGSSAPSATPDSSILGRTDDARSVADSEGTNRSSVSDFAFDGQMGWNPRNSSSVMEAQRQRWQPPIMENPGTGSSGASSNVTTSQKRFSSREQSNASFGQPLLPTRTHQSTASTSSASSAGGAPPIPVRHPRIVKRTSVDQMSERVNPWQGEAMSDRGSISSNEWTASDHDTSGLSVEKIHKLRKKGINPALYAEMKNARKGKSKWISPLQGNSYLS